MSLHSACARERATLPHNEAAPVFVVTPSLRFGDPTLWVIYLCLGLSVLIVQVAAIAHGLWFVSVLAGLAGCAFIVALHVQRLSREQQREEIAITDSEVVIRRFSAGGAAQEMRMQLWGLNLTRCEDRVDRCQQLLLNSTQTRVEIGRDLSPHERASLATALTHKLRAAGSPVTVNVSPPLALILSDKIGQ